MKIMVLDGHTVSALACVRQLGRSGHEVMVGTSQDAATLAGYSRFAKPFEYHDPGESPAKFIHELSSVADAFSPRVILPCTDRTTLPLAALSEQHALRKLCPLPSYKSVETAYRKDQTLTLANRLGIACPETYIVKTANEISKAVTFPAVVKPAFSYAPKGAVTFEQSELPALGERLDVTFACNAVSLEEACRSFFNQGVPVLIQEWIRGNGIGVCTVYHRGKPLTWFLHERIREEHPLGGRSAYCKSIPPEESLIATSKKLLDSLNWHGPAMVEFRRDIRDGVPKLMEINGRFWGSLPLGIAAGVPFPELAIQTVTAEPQKSLAPYKAGVLGRYWLADRRWIKSVLGGAPNFWAGPYPGRVSSLIKYLVTERRYDVDFVIDPDDPEPYRKQSRKT